jgi:hypothetical protein
MKIQLLAGIGALLGVAACAPTTPTFDHEFGNAVRALHAQQVRHPDAPTANAARAADGLDGRSASEAIGRYHRSFASPDTSPAQPAVLGAGTSIAR